MLGVKAVACRYCDFRLVLSFPCPAFASRGYRGLLMYAVGRGGGRGRACAPAGLRPRTRAMEVVNVTIGRNSGEETENTGSYHESN